MENAGFVVDRGALKDKDDWLITDVGSFRNLGNSCKIGTVKNGAVTDVVTATGRDKRKPVLQANQYFIKTVYWCHYNERQRLLSHVYHNDKVHRRRAATWTIGVLLSA